MEVFKMFPSWLCWQWHCIWDWCVKWVHVGVESLFHAVIRHLGWWRFCHLQSMASKIALSIASIPVSWKWEGVWMSTHGRLLSVAYVLVPITFCWLHSLFCWYMVTPLDARCKRAWVLVNCKLSLLHSFESYLILLIGSPMASHLPKMEFTFLAWSFHVTLFFTLL